MSQSAHAEPDLSRFSLEGRTAVITGASLNIGAAISLGFAAAGADVVLVARGRERLSAHAAHVRDRTGRHVVEVAIDVTAPEAPEVIEEAIRVLGPTSDLLDTRAVVYLAQGKAKEAAADMRWALVDGPSISKYYHMARVEQALGNADAAREALKKANDLRGDHNPFTPAERTAFEQLQKELN